MSLSTTLRKIIEASVYEESKIKKSKSAFLVLERDKGRLRGLVLDEPPI